MRIPALVSLALAAFLLLAAPSAAPAWIAISELEPEGPGVGGLDIFVQTAVLGSSSTCDWDGAAKHGDCHLVFGDHSGPATVTLTATPAAGSVFDTWVGGCPGVISGATANVCEYTADDELDDFTLRPRFELLPVGPPPAGTTLTVTLLGTGAGAVTSLDGGIDCGPDCAETYPDGTLVTLSADPAPGSGFIEWGGACASLAPDCSLTASGGTVDVTATFVLAGTTGCDIVGTAGNDLLVGTSGPETICGLGGDDVIRGNGGPDTLRGGPGADRLLGNAGADTLAGGSGADALDGGMGRDTGNGGRGADTCTRVEVRTSCS